MNKYIEGTVLDYRLYVVFVLICYYYIKGEMNGE